KGAAALGLSKDFCLPDRPFFGWHAMLQDIEASRSNALRCNCLLLDQYFNQSQLDARVCLRRCQGLQVTLRFRNKPRFASKCLYFLQVLQLVSRGIACLDNPENQAVGRRRSLAHRIKRSNEIGSMRL